MNIRVREFVDADREPLRAVYLASRVATFPWTDAELYQATDFDAHTEGELILVALLDAEIVGFASIWEQDSFLHNLFVQPSALRKGVGRALLARCMEYFRETPTLKCLQQNDNATGFYLSQGWDVVREEIGPEGPYLLMTKTAKSGGDRTEQDLPRNTIASSH
jgi:GNAT superfamily N-acetyltransferase